MNYVENFSLLARSEILKLVVNTLTADGKYSHHIRENLPQPIQMQLCKNPITFLQSFIAPLKFKWNLKHFKEKDMNLMA